MTSLINKSVDWPPPNYCKTARTFPQIWWRSKMKQPTSWQRVSRIKWCHHITLQRSFMTQYLCTEMVTNSSIDPPNLSNFRETISEQVSSKWASNLCIKVIITTRKRSLGQGDVFTLVCHSFCTQGGLPQCMLGYHTPSGSRPPRPDTPVPPWSRIPLGADPVDQAHAPSWEQTPLGGVHAGRYGQRACGTHPTGMHSRSL